MTLATCNAVLCEFMPRIFSCRSLLCQQKCVEARLACRAVVPRLRDEGGLGRRSSAKRRRLDNDSDYGQDDKQNRRACLGQDDRVLNQIRPHHRGENDQRPVEQGEQQNRADDAADDKCGAGII